MGIYRDSSEEYHSQDHIGATSLKQMNITPAHFYESWRGPKKESPSFDEGNLVHSVLLEQNLDSFIRRPDGIDGRTKDGKTRLEELAATGKKVITGEIYDSLERRLDSFVKSSEAMRKYNGAQIEQSFYAQDKETGLFIKARPDIYKPGFISDLKTTQNMRIFENQIWNMGYFIQAGLYSLVTEIVTSTEVLEFSFIAQEKAAPYGIKVFHFERSTLNFCKERVRELLNRVAVCIDENRFEGYDDVSTTISVPQWVLSNELTFSEVI